MLAKKTQSLPRQALYNFVLCSIMLLGITHTYAQETCDDIDCVMPGDANQDGMADVWDLLRLGVSYGMSGPARPLVSTEWKPQKGQDWPMSQFDGTNYKHVDCNGDGLVTLDDISAIHQNYKDEQNYVCQASPESNYILSIEILNEFITPGDQINTQISLTSKDGSPVEDVYGLAFRVAYNDHIIQDNSTELSYVNSWLGQPYELLSIKKEFFNRIDIGTTKITQDNSSGSGDILQMTAVMEEVILGIVPSVDLILRDVVVTDKNGNIIPVDVQNASKEINYTTGLEKLEEDNTLLVYPNPSADKFNFVVQANIEVEYLEIFDMNGKIVNLTDLPKNKNEDFAIDISDLSPGMYFVKVFVKQGVIQRPLMVAR